MTTVIGFVNEKGGVGKSTLSCAVAVQAVKAGNKTLLLDLDSQGDSSGWMLKGVVDEEDQESGEVYHSKVAPGLDVVWVTERNEYPQLGRYDVVVADGRPAGAVGGAILGLATFVVMPYTDRQGHKNAQRLADLAQCPCVIVMNRIHPPRSGRKLGNKKLVGYDAALRRHRWHQAHFDLFEAMMQLYAEEGVPRGTQTS